MITETTVETPEEAALYTKERARFVAGLREFADFLEHRTDLATPYTGSFDVFASNKAELVDIARSDSFDKEHVGDYFSLTKRFGPIVYNINIKRDQVCVKRVVGVREEPARTVEIVEWDCTESLLK